MPVDNSKVSNNRSANTLKLIHTHKLCYSLLQANRLIHQEFGFELASCNHREHLILTMRRHTVATQYLQLIGDNPIHRNRRRAVLAKHQAHLDMLSAFA